MIHTFKSCGIQAAVDSRDGAIRILDSLTYSMIPSLPPADEMTKELPTSIRYAFAKYDSQDLKRAYGELYDLYTAEKSKADAEIGEYAIVSAIAENTLASLPVESRVLAYIADGKCAEWLVRTYPALVFDFAADASLCISGIFADVTAVFEFSEAKELIDKVTELFGQGISKIAGYPKAGVAERDAVEAYDKLCRELVRMRKKGETGVFVPFAFGESFGALAVIDGETITRYHGGTFSAVYMENGMMPLNAVFLHSDVLIDKCAECAVVLSAK